MKKFLVISGGVFIALIIVAVIGFAIIAKKGSELDKESKSYIDHTVPIILSDLTKETFYKYASQTVIESTSEEDLDKLISAYKKLGDFKKYEESKGQAGMHYNAQGKTITAEYIAKVEFESGPAKISIALIKHNQEWKIQMFRIDSKVFLDL